MNLNKTIEAIHNHAKTKGPKEYRIVRDFPIGAVVRQGDVYIMRVSDAKASKQTSNRQLAPGTTKGSRHIVEGEVTVYAKWDAAIANLFEGAAKVLRVNRSAILEALKGPAISAPGAFRVTHPEHADYTLPAGDYVTWGQLDPRTMRRVQD